MNSRVRLLVLLVVFAAHGMAKSPAPGWDAFWAGHGVDPAPPRTFLQAGALEHGRVRNLTNGKLPDATVERWVNADARRGAGDLWTLDNLRVDIAKAGVLGPPGLNGTSEEIEALLKSGVVRVESSARFETLAVAVVVVTKAQKLASPSAGLTDYVIVRLRRATGKPGVRIFRDGHAEQFGKLAAGTLRCQIDTGYFLDDPTLGPLWYQSDGWTAFPNDGTPLGGICGLVLGAK